MEMSLCLQPKPNVVVTDGCARHGLHYCDVHGQLMDLLKTWEMLITLFYHNELQTQTYTLCLIGTINIPSKVLKELKEQDP